MASKMLHRGSMPRLIPTETNFTLLSTCFLLLIQFQIFHALPTSSLPSNGASNRQDTSVIIRSASSPSTAYGSAYPYSSYRPGPRLEDSYRPYSAYAKDFSNSGLYAPDHPNSVYSRQSLPSSNTLQQNLDKVFKLIEKEMVVSDLQQQQSLKNLPGPSNTSDKQETSPKLGSLALGNNNTPVRNNKPRLLPLPTIIQSTTSSTNDETNNTGRKEFQQQQNINKEQQQSATTSIASGLAEEKQVRSAEFSPMPPPFAPELDPQYERRQYGLGALTLLDQAGPFW